MPTTRASRQPAVTALVVILLFGAGKLPRLMGDAAKGINAFKKNLKDDKSDPPNDQAMSTDTGDAVPDPAKNDETAKS